MQIRLSKRDFEQKIASDKEYVESLKMHAGILARFITKTQPILAGGNRIIQAGGQSTNFDLLELEYGRASVELPETIKKLQIQDALLNDSVEHFENNFMPDYIKKIEDMKENFDTVHEAAKAHTFQYKKALTDFVGWEKEEELKLYFYTRLKVILLDAGKE